MQSNETPVPQEVRSEFDSGFDLGRMLSKGEELCPFAVIDDLTYHGIQTGGVFFDAGLREAARTFGVIATSTKVPELPKVPVIADMVDGKFTLTVNKEVSFAESTTIETVTEFYEQRISPNGNFGTPPRMLFGSPEAEEMLFSADVSGQPRSIQELMLWWREIPINRMRVSDLQNFYAAPFVDHTAANWAELLNVHYDGVLTHEMWSSILDYLPQAETFKPFDASAVFTAWRSLGEVEGGNLFDEGDNLDDEAGQSVINGLFFAGQGFSSPSVWANLLGIANLVRMFWAGDLVPAHMHGSKISVPSQLDGYHSFSVAEEVMSISDRLLEEVRDGEGGVTALHRSFSLSEPDDEDGDCSVYCLGDLGYYEQDGRRFLVRSLSISDMPVVSTTSWGTQHGGRLEHSLSVTKPNRKEARLVPLWVATAAAEAE